MQFFCNQKFRKTCFAPYFYIWRAQRENFACFWIITYNFISKNMIFVRFFTKYFANFPEILRKIWNVLQNLWEICKIFAYLCLKKTLVCSVYSPPDTVLATLRSLFLIFWKYETSHQFIFFEKCETSHRSEFLKKYETSHQFWFFMKAMAS